MKGASGSVGFPASPKKVASASLSEAVSTSPSLTSLAQDESGSEEEDENLKPRGLYSNTLFICWLNF